MWRVQATTLATLCLMLGGCHTTNPRTPARLCETSFNTATLRAWPAGSEDTATSVNYRLDGDVIEIKWACVDDFIVTPNAGRDSDLYKGDVVELFIDPAGDGRRIVEIQVNPNNDVLDLLLHYASGRELTEGGRLTEASVAAHFRSERQFNLDDLQTAAGRSPNGYWVVLRIPIDALRRAAGMETIDLSAMRWNLVRLDRHRDGRVVQTSLVRVEPGCPHISPDRTAPCFKDPN